MIEPMYKYSLVIYHQDFEEFLSKLQALGLLHISIENSEIQGRENSLYKFLLRLDEAITNIKHIEGVSKRKDELRANALLYAQNLGHQTPSALLTSHEEEARATFMYIPIPQILRRKRQLTKLAKKEGMLLGTPEAPYCILSAYEAMHRIEDLLTEKNTTEQQIKKYYKDLEEAKIWGNFSPRAVANLQAETGLKIHYLTTSEKVYQASWEQEYPIYEISRVHASVYFVYFQRDEEMPDWKGVTEVPAPKSSYSYKRRVIIILEARMEDIIHELEDMYIYLSTLEEEKLNYMNRLSFDTSKENAHKEAEEHIRIVEGFVPQSKSADFETFLDAQHTVYIQSSAMEAAKAGENVPVLLKNNAFARLFEPITGLFALPSYTEMDLTPLFAPFFMMFFGFCFGDAGYGILLFALSTILKYKVSIKLKPFCTLAQYFGLATVFFGLISGSFFGIALAEVSALVKFKKYFLNSDNMMALSLMLGGVQILFGMFIQILNIKRREGMRHAISRIGWFSLLILALPLLAQNFLKFTLYPIVEYAIYGGMGVSLCLAFFFNAPEKNIFMNFGGGLWDAYNVLTGLIGDLLSYIRLFALGLTGGILGSVFNTLALDMSGNIPVLSTFIMFLILLVGHSLNIGLSILGALVHPLRLTFVEFYKNAGFEGAGKPYKPFKIITKEK